MTTGLRITRDGAVRCQRTGKLMFTSPGAADKRRKTLKRRGDAQAAYRCTHCHCWHLGHRFGK